jgi:hypothetical protein
VPRRAAAVHSVPLPRVQLALAYACTAALTATALHAQLTIAQTGRVIARVQPETVTVGQPFVVTLRAIPPALSQAIAPAVPDTGGMVEPLDPANVIRRGDTLLVRYRLIAWQTGVLSIPLGPVLMRSDSAELSVPVEARVVVASVLPADTANRVPKDARDLFPLAQPWWNRMWAWALAIALGIGLVWLFELWRRRRKRAPAVLPTPLARAEVAFARLDARQLPSAGEGARHVALAGEIAREYLSDISVALPLALTNAEAVIAARAVDGVPDALLRDVATAVDDCRFGGDRVTAARAHQVAELAREFVRETDRLRSTVSVRAA